MIKLLFFKKNYFYIIIFFLSFLFLNNSFANTITLKSAGALAFDKKQSKEIKNSTKNKIIEINIFNEREI